MAKTSSPSNSTDDRYPTIYIDDNMVTHLVGKTYGGWTAFDTRCGMPRSDNAQRPDPRLFPTCVACIVTSWRL